VSAQTTSEAILNRENVGGGGTVAIVARINNLLGKNVWTEWISSKQDDEFTSGSGIVSEKRGGLDVAVNGDVIAVGTTKGNLMDETAGGSDIFIVRMSNAKGAWHSDYSQSGRTGGVGNGDGSGASEGMDSVGVFFLVAGVLFGLAFALFLGKQWGVRRTESKYKAILDHTHAEFSVQQGANEFNKYGGGSGNGAKNGSNGFSNANEKQSNANGNHKANEYREQESASDPNGFSSGNDIELTNGNHFSSLKDENDGGDQEGSTMIEFRINENIADEDLIL
jgi:hypothetical protein